MSNAPEKIKCQPWATSNGVDDWSDGSFGVSNSDDRASVQYTRSDLIPQWQPIETAPKDGTRMLGFFPRKDFGKSHISECYWMEHRRFDDGGYFYSLVYNHPAPTHWHPLPPPP